MIPTREERLFELVLENPPAERGAFLKLLCGEDETLRRRVEALLAAHNPEDSFMGGEAGDKSTVRIEVEDNPPPEDIVGETIGRYKLLQKVGEGGCGVVYVAEQQKPVRRRVALKVIKLGMDTKSVVARFEAERQALALMDHPNIAKVLDAGATDTGRPYFVMELVRGIKITDYCDQNKLSTGERLDLFIKICHAIQHAHQKGIIHRDIKPSNILITLHDGVPIPKVIDFGIAKATEGRLTELTVYTELHQFIGTPAYMSPEQAEMSGLDVDTRSDIYSLGVLLYELLTGRTPFDAQELMALGIDAMRHVIREKEPPRPSTKLSTLAGGDLTTTAQRRSVEPSRLASLLRGDLDWIAMKCLEKDRTRRYETANGLAMDIKRHLDNEPVVARPPSKLYEFQKTVRRHKVGFAATAAVIVALASGVVLTTWQALRATTAERQQSQLRQRAETEATRAKAVSDFMLDLLSSANPDTLKGSEYTVRQLLEDFSGDISEQLEGQSEVEATVRHTIGRAFSQLGLGEKAVPHLERALDLNRTVHGDASEAVVECLNDLAWAWHDYESASRQYTREMRWEQAKPYLREAQLICQRQGDDGRENLISALGIEQWYMTDLNRDAEVETLAKDAMAIAARPPSIEVPYLANLIHQLAQVQIRQGRNGEAETSARKAVAMHKRLRSPDDFNIGYGLHFLGEALLGQKKLPQARAAFEEALAIFSKQYDYEHVSVRNSMGRLRETLEKQMDWPALESLLNRILQAQRDKSLKNDPSGQGHDVNVVPTLLQLANVVSEQGRPEQASVYSDEAISILSGLADASMPAGLMPNGVSQDLVRALYNLADRKKSQGRFGEAEALYRTTQEIQRRFSNKDQIDFLSLGWSFVHLGEALQNQQKSTEARAAYAEALTIFSEQPMTGDELLTALTSSLLLRQDWPALADVFQKCLSARRAFLLNRVPSSKGEDAGVGFLLYGLSKIADSDNRAAEAESYRQSAFKILSQGEATNVCTFKLAGLVRDDGDLETALHFARQSLRVRANGRKGWALNPLCLTASLLDALGRPEEARETLRRGIDLWKEYKAAGARHDDEPLGNFVSALLSRGMTAEAELIPVDEATMVGRLNALAWHYATSPDPTVRDGGTAVRLAERAVAASGRTDPQIVDTLAAAYAEAGDFTNAVRTQQEALVLLPADEANARGEFEARLRLYQSGQPYREAGALASQADSLLRAGDFAKAESLARDCLKLREVMIPDHWLTFNAMSMLGGALLGQKKYPHAEPLLLSAYEGMKQREASIPPVGKPRLTEAAKRLAELYEATDKPAEAAKWRGTVLELETAAK